VSETTPTQRAVAALAIVVLGALAITDLWARSHAMRYSGDEIFNLDTVITLYRTGDYTTRHLGGHPFDPVVSAGVVTTWVDGLVFMLGGSLFQARLLDGLLHLLVVTALAFALARSRGVDRLAAVALSLAVWVATLLVTGQELRIINGGEIWAFAYLAAGTFLIDRRPRAACFLWGLAVWLGKIIYLPFATVLLVVTIASRIRADRARGHLPGLLAPVREAATLLLAFMLPLLAWMSIVWLSTDTATLLAWSSSYVVFVVHHSTGIHLAWLPVMQGWDFDPGWISAPFLSWGPAFFLPALVPLALAPLALVAYGVLMRRGTVRSTGRDATYLFVTGAMVTAFGAWFLAVDPTQWGRHLLPGIYVSVALALYCALDVWRQLPPRSQARRRYALVACASMAVLSALSATRIADYVERMHWKASYAKTCRGNAVLEAPCMQDGALFEIVTLAREVCDITGDPFDPAEQCMTRERTELLGRAMQLARQTGDPRETIYRGGYMTLLIQSYNYPFEDDFVADFTPLTCAPMDSMLRDYLESAGLDIARFKQSCDRGP